jgi:hypothetical protein
MTHKGHISITSPDSEEFMDLILGSQPNDINAIK